MRVERPRGAARTRAHSRRSRRRWRDRESHGESPETLCFVDATMHHDARCDVCGVTQARGTQARVGLGGDRAARRIVCTACPAETRADATAALLAVGGAAALEDSVPPRGSMAAWIGGGALGVAALIGSRTGRRVMKT